VHCGRSEYVLHQVCIQRQPTRHFDMAPFEFPKSSHTSSSKIALPVRPFTRKDDWWRSLDLKLLQRQVANLIGVMKPRLRTGNATQRPHWLHAGIFRLLGYDLRRVPCSFQSVLSRHAKGSAFPSGEWRSNWVSIRVPCGLGIWAASPHRGQSEADHESPSDSLTMIAILKRCTDSNGLTAR